MENFEMEWNSFGISLDGVLVKLDEVWVRFGSGLEESRTSLEQLWKILK